jgi:hypothetical protein
MTKQQLRETIRRIIKQELNEEKTVPNPNAGKWRIVGIESGAPLTKEFYKSKEEAQAAARELGRIKSSGIKYIQLKDTMKVNEEPAVADPDTEEDVETTPYISPDEDDDDLNIGGNPNTNPKMPPQATAKEKVAIKQIIDRYMSLSNLNEKKYK